MASLQANQATGASAPSSSAIWTTEELGPSNPKASPQIARIVETPGPDGSFMRTLEFDDGRKLLFPRDRVTILDEDKLYDWYGRQIQVDGKIKRVLKPLGSKTAGTLLGYAQETYLVELEDGLLNVAYAGYQKSKEKTDLLPEHKVLMAGLGQIYPMELKPAKEYPFKREAEELYDTPVFRTYTNCQRHPKEIRIFSGVQDTSWYKPQQSELTLFYGTEVSSVAGWEYHYFMPSRESILAIPKDTDFGFDRPTGRYTNYLIGDIAILDGGTKISSHCYYKDKNGNYLRVSTDVETIENLSGNFGLYWYEDPET